MPISKRSSKRSRSKRCRPCKPCTREHLKVPTFDYEPTRNLLKYDCHGKTDSALCRTKGYCEWRNASKHGSLRKTKAMCALSKGRKAVQAGKAVLDKIRKQQQQQRMKSTLSFVPHRTQKIQQEIKRDNQQWDPFKL